MSIEYFKYSCLVCGNDGHGLHFGVTTCRACAAFFRRSLVKNIDYECKKNEDQCDFSKNFCKSCRLQKCHQLGMSLEKTPKWQQVTKPETLHQFRERIAYCIWHPTTNKPVRFIDVGPMLRRSRNVLNHFDLPTSEEFRQWNSLEKMTYALKRARFSQSKKPVILKTMLSDDYFCIWEEHMVRTAEWMMHSDEFRALPGHERLAFFKIIWAVCRRFERNSLGPQVYGRRCYDEKLLILSDEITIKFDDFTVDISEISSKRFEEYRGSMRDNLFQYFENVVKPIVDWELSETEVCFALCQILWNYAARKLNGQTQKAADVFLEEISNNLHEFYRKEQKTRNYAARLAVIMEMVNNVLRIQRDHEKVMEMAFLFDMFRVVFSDPMFFSV